MAYQSLRRCLSPSPLPKPPQAAEQGRNGAAARGMATWEGGFPLRFIRRLVIIHQPLCPLSKTQWVQQSSHPHAPIACMHARMALKPKPPGK